jgi:SAM-dependent methyltransferase
MTAPRESNYTSEYLRQYQDADFEPLLVAVRRLELLRSAALYKHDNIIEIGCALEPLYPHLDHFAAYTIVEASDDMARTAARNAADLPNVRVVNSTLEDAAANLGCDFDWVVCSSVLHEVSDPAAFLSAVRSVCKPNTICHLSVPNALSFHRLLAVEMELIDRVDDLSERDRRFGHPAVFDKGSLRALVATLGFRVVREGTFFIKPFTHAQMSTLLEREIVPRNIVEGLYRLSNYFPENGCELFVEVQLERTF